MVCCRCGGRSKGLRYSAPIRATAATDAALLITTIQLTREGEGRMKAMRENLIKTAGSGVAGTTWATASALHRRMAPPKIQAPKYK